MNRTANFSIMLLLALMAAANARGEMGAGTITSSTKELNGGMVYTVQGNVTLSGATSTSALTVKSNSGDNGKRVVIDIPEGCSLTVTGGDAGNVGGRIGAGAGIELPSDMTLYITGKGSLTATGGNAANGGNGGAGSGASRDGASHTNGKGGDGGHGGGGAAAAIGGKGGQGASGTSGGGNETRVSSGSNFAKNGSNGGTSTDASTGSAGGAVYILGDVAVTVRGGSAGASGAPNGTYGTYSKEDAADDWFAGGGGPGGAGGGGGLKKNLKIEL